MATVIPNVWALKTKRVWGVLLLFLPQIILAMGYDVPQALFGDMDRIAEAGWALGALVFAFWGANKAHLRKIYWFGKPPANYTRGLVGPILILSAALGLGGCVTLFKGAPTAADKAGRVLDLVSGAVTGIDLVAGLVGLDIATPAELRAFTAALGETKTGLVHMTAVVEGIVKRYDEAKADEARAASAAAAAILVTR